MFSSDVALKINLMINRTKKKMREYSRREQNRKEKKRRKMNFLHND